MNVHIPPSPARGGPPRAPYNLKTTIFPGVSIADYSTDRLQFAPDLSRIVCPPNGKFDTFAFINPWLAHDSRAEECYWEVTLLTKGLCQIGAAIITQSRRMTRDPFLPDPLKGDGVGDVGFSIGFDLSRSTAFISNKSRDQPPKYPFTWNVGDTLSFHMLPPVGSEGCCRIRAWLTTPKGSTALHTHDFQIGYQTAEPCITLQQGQAVSVNLGQHPFRLTPPPELRSFLDVVTAPYRYTCYVCNARLRFEGFRCIDCPPEYDNRTVAPYRSFTGYCVKHFPKLEADGAHAVLCHRWAYFNADPGYSSPQTLVTSLQPPEAYHVPWSCYITAVCSFCRCTKSWCWMRSSASSDLVSCYNCFSPSSEDFIAAMPWVALTNPAATVYTSPLQHFSAPPEPLLPVPSAYSAFDPNSTPTNTSPTYTQLEAQAPAAPPPSPASSVLSNSAYATFDPKTSTPEQRYAQVPTNAYASVGSFSLSSNSMSGTYSAVSQFDYESEEAAPQQPHQPQVVAAQQESKVGALAAPEQARAQAAAATKETRNWNVEEASVMAMPETAPGDIAAKIEAFRKLRAAFVAAAAAVAKTVVTEVPLPVDRKTIKPVDVGGVAGGTKYIHNGIFVKFAVDTAGIYGGNSFAAKSAALELRGLRSYLECNIPGLNIPLMAVMDYKGWTMIATPLLPVSRHTLVYGSNDAGVTVFKSDPHMNHLMELAGQRLNLKPHLCGLAGQVEELSAPTDIEGHRGTDGNYYVLDTARVCPPEKPFRSVLGLHITQKDSESNNFNARPIELMLKAEKWRSQVAQVLGIELAAVQSRRLSWDADVFYTGKGKLNAWASLLSGYYIIGDALILFSFGVRGKALYCLLRPELVRSFSKPLSSDAYTMFGRANSAVNNLEVAEATDYIRNSVIPAFVAMLHETKGTFPVADFINEMHKRGIPVRFLSAVASAVEQQTWSIPIQRILTLVAQVRAFKLYVRSLLRDCRTDEDYRECVADNLNFFLGKNYHAERFHETVLLASAMSKFAKYGFPEWLMNRKSYTMLEANLRAMLFLLTEPYLGIRLHRRFHCGADAFHDFHCTVADMAEVPVGVRTVVDDMIRSKEDTLLELSRVPGFSVALPLNSQLGLTHLAWRAKRALEANAFVEAERMAQELRAALKDSPKYINVACMLLYVEGCLAQNRGDDTRAELLFWHAYISLLYSHPYLADLSHTDLRFFGLTLQPLAGLIIDRLMWVINEEQIEVRSMLAESFILLVQNSKHPLIRLMLQLDMPLIPLVARHDARDFEKAGEQFATVTQEQIDQCLEATNLKPNHANQEYDIDVIDMPLAVKKITAKYVRGFKLAVDTCFVNDLVPYEVSEQGFEDSEARIIIRNLSNGEHWPNFPGNLNADYAPATPGRLTIPGRFFPEPGNYWLCFHTAHLASRPVFITVLPPTASRNPADKCYFYFDEALASPVSFVMPYTAPFRVVQVVYNVQSALILLETGAVFGMGYNSSGELGLGDTNARVSPTHVRSLLTPVRSITMSTNSCGEVASGAIDTEGCVWLWGSGKANLGAGEALHVTSTPRCLEASFGCKAMKISMGTSFAFVIDEQMRTWYWGANAQNSKYNAIVPTLHPDFIGQRMVSVAVASPRAIPDADFVMFLNENGQIWTWGRMPCDNANKNYKTPKLRSKWPKVQSACHSTFGTFFIGKDMRKVYAYYPRSPAHGRNDVASTTLEWYLLTRNMPLAVSTAVKPTTFIELPVVPTRGLIVELSTAFHGYRSDRRGASNDRLLCRTNLGELFQLAPHYAPKWQPLNRRMKIPNDEFIASAFYFPRVGPAAHRPEDLGTTTYVIATRRVTPFEKAQVEQAIADHNQLLKAERDALEARKQEDLKPSTSAAVTSLRGGAAKKADAAAGATTATSGAAASPLSASQKPTALAATSVAVALTAVAAAPAKPAVISLRRPGTAVPTAPLPATPSPPLVPAPVPAVVPVAHTTSVVSAAASTAPALSPPAPLSTFQSKAAPIVRSAPVVTAPAPAPTPPALKAVPKSSVSAYAAETPVATASSSSLPVSPSPSLASSNADGVSRFEFEALKAQVQAQQEQINTLLRLLGQST